MKIKKAEYLDMYNIKLYFNNGTYKVIDFFPLIEGLEKLTEVKDLSYFKNFFIDDITICWPNGLDFCPDFLYDPVEFKKSFSVYSSHA